MKKLLFLTAFLAFCASTASFAQQSDPKATEILKGVGNKYKGYQSLRAVFLATIENGQGKVTESNTGTLYLKGSKYKIELANQDIISDNKTVWTFLKGANEVQVNDYVNDENSINPSQIFTLYEKNFLYAVVEEKTVNGKVMVTIDLTPNDKTRNYFKVRLVIDKAEKSIVKATVFDKSGSKMNYEMQKLTPNFPLTDVFFSFDPKTHPGVEVVDLR